MPEIVGALLAADEELELELDELELELLELDELELELDELELELELDELELDELELDDVPLLFVTVMLKPGSERLAMPSLTLMMMLEYTTAVVGFPVSKPVDELKLAQAGLLLIVNTKGSPGVSVAVGWNRYVTPTVAVVVGVPLIFGITLCHRNG